MNQVIHWDCLEEMDKLIALWIKVDCLLVDPPYWMDFQSNHRKEKYNKIANDKSLEWIDDFIEKTYSLMNENTHWYIFCSFHNIDIFKQAAEKKFKLKNILIWEKNNTSMWDLKWDYAPKYEMILFIHKWRRELLWWFRYANIFKFARSWNKNHPTEKPVDMLEFLIKNSTREWEIILDCFAWSGSLWVACQNLNRKFILIEQEQAYIDIINTRLNLTC